MSSILNRIGGKKPKMSTLEKSKMDWDAFKSEEGITEELAIHNRGKEGYDTVSQLSSVCLHLNLQRTRPIGNYSSAASQRRLLSALRLRRLRFERRRLLLSLFKNPKHEQMCEECFFVFIPSNTVCKLAKSLC